MMMPRTFCNRHHTSMRHLTLNMFELNRSVVDAEVVVEAFFYIPENPLAHRRWNVCDRNMAGKRSCLRTDAPAVQIMNVIDAVYGPNRRCNKLQLQAARRPLQQNIQGFADDAETRPQN